MRVRSRDRAPRSATRAGRPRGGTRRDGVPPSACASWPSCRARRATRSCRRETCRRSEMWFSSIDAAERCWQGRDEQAVKTSCDGADDRSRSVATEPIGDEPLVLPARRIVAIAFTRPRAAPGGQFGHRSRASIGSRHAGRPRRETRRSRRAAWPGTASDPPSMRALPCPPYLDPSLDQSVCQHVPAGGAISGSERVARSRPRPR